MARNNRGGSSRGSSTGRQSSSSRGSSSNRGSDRSGAVMEMARDRPIAAAAVAAGAAAAGLFLWSRRSQISNQLSNLSDQISEWTENMGSGGSFGSGDDTAGLTSVSSSSGRQAGERNRQMSETGAGNASLGAMSGGSGTMGSASGRGRARSTAATQE